MATKLSDMLISAIFISGIAGMLLIFISSGVNTYTVTDYDNTTLEELDKLQELSTTTESLSNSTQIRAEQGALSVLDSLVDKAFNSVLILGQSINILASMIITLIGATNFGPFGVILRRMVIAIIFTFVFVGVMRVITKVDI